MARARGCFSPPSRRHGGSAVAAAARPCSFPIPSTPPTPRARWRRIASRFICRRPPRPAFFPISMHSRKSCSRARLLSSSPRLPTRRARLPTSPISRAWSRSPGGSVSSYSATNAIPRSTPGAHPRACSKRRVPILPTWSSSSRCPSARTCRGCASALPPATDNSSGASWSCATSRRRKCRCRRSAWPSPPMATRCMSKKIAGSTRKNSISPTRSSATATVTGGRPADSFCGSTSRRRAATKRWRCGCGARRGCASCRAAISRATRPTARIPGAATSASPWCRTRTRRHRRSTASSRCSAEGDHGGHRPRPRQSELPLRRHARRSTSAPARARRPHPDRARDARCARARDLVGAGSLAQPCHECARAQHSRRVRRHCRRPADAALRPGRARLHPADRHLGLAPRHPPADAARARAPAVLAAGRAAHRRLRRRAAAQQRLAAARWARRRDRRLDAASAGGAFRRNAGGVGAGFGWRAEGDDAEGPLEEDEARGWFPLGWITHGFLSFKARLARALTRRPSARAPARSETPPQARIEPRFDAGARATLQPAVAPEADDEEEASPQAARKPRAAPRAPRRSPSGGYVLPSLELLAAPKAIGRAMLSADALQTNATALEGVLADFGVRGEIINARPGPVVTLYELEPAPGIKSSRVIGLADDIARSMSALSARVAVVAGRNVIGIELPNPTREKVYLREQLASRDYVDSSAKLPLCLGKTIGGEPVIVDLARMPHLLIA